MRANRAYNDLSIRCAARVPSYALPCACEIRVDGCRGAGGRGREAGMWGAQIRFPGVCVCVVLWSGAHESRVRCEAQASNHTD